MADIDYGGEFMRGFQVGSNLILNAERMRQQREETRMQAQQLMSQIRAAQALDDFKRREMVLRESAAKQQEAEEKRKVQEFEQQQRFPQLFRQRRDALMANTGYGQEPGMPQEQMQGINQQAVFEASIDANLPQTAMSVLAQGSRSEIEDLRQENQNLRHYATLALREAEAEKGRKADVAMEGLRQTNRLALADHRKSEVDKLNPEEQEQLRRIKSVYTEKLQVAMPNEFESINELWKADVDRFFASRGKGTTPAPSGTVRRLIRDKSGKLIFEK